MGFSLLPAPEALEKQSCWSFKGDMNEKGELIFEGREHPLSVSDFILQ